MWDAVVLGGRCAGAATALLLARQGHRVLVVERARFPADTMSTLYIHQPGIARLADWGVLDAIIASNCPPLTSVSYHVGDVVLRGPTPAADGVTATYAPRRHILDTALIDAAVRAGATFADGCSFIAPVADDDGRVVGVRLSAGHGSEAVEHARLVVGADGMRSRLARLVGAAENVHDPRMTCVYYTGWTGISGGFGFRERPGHWIATIPTHDGVTLVATYFPQRDFPAIRTDPMSWHLRAVRTVAPDIFDEMSSGEQVVRLHGTGDQRNFFRKAWGPGWVLVGDAGHHRDTITAHGIANAFLQAQMLADEVPPELADRGRTDEALSRFEAQRDQEFADGYRGTLEVARLEVAETRLASLRAISRHSELTERYFAVVAGLLPMDDFLTPELAELL